VLSGDNAQRRGVEVEAMGDGDCVDGACGCGTPSVAVSAGQLHVDRLLRRDDGDLRIEVFERLPALVYQWEQVAAPNSSPSAGPRWLGIFERRNPTIAARHLVATRGDSGLALLPGYLLEHPDHPDLDPRTYLGWRPASGEVVCCDTASFSDQQPQSSPLEDLDAGRLFPALLLGSPFGYKTEIVHSFWQADLAQRLLQVAVEQATREGVKTVYAPWVADHHSGAALASALEQADAVASFWALEDHFPLEHGSYQAHLATMKGARRYRHRKDLEAAHALGLAVRPLGDGELDRWLGRIGELSASNRQKYGVDATADDATAVIGELQAGGVPVLVTGGFLDGELVACCVCFVKGDRVYPKYTGFAYELLGERSGAYFTVVLHAVIDAAYQRGFKAVEFGVGAHHAKALRGCAARTVTSYTLPTDPAMTPLVQQAAQANAQRRSSDFALTG
jgi:predicted N-acyltransferase